MERDKIIELCTLLKDLIDDVSNKNNIFTYELEHHEESSWMDFRMYSKNDDLYKKLSIRISATSWLITTNGGTNIIDLYEVKDWLDFINRLIENEYLYYKLQIIFSINKDRRHYHICLSNYMDSFLDFYYKEYRMVKLNLNPNLKPDFNIFINYNPLTYEGTPSYYGKEFSINYDLKYSESNKYYNLTIFYTLVNYNKNRISELKISSTSLDYIQSFFNKFNYSQVAKYISYNKATVHYTENRIDYYKQSKKRALI